MLATPDRQISLSDPDARSMATSGRGSGMVGYNVQAAVDTKHHLIVAHEVTNVGTDRSQLAHMAKQTKAALETETLDVVADRGYFSSAEILACDEAGITVTLPKPLTSNNQAKGRFVKQDFRYVKQEDGRILPFRLAGQPIPLSSLLGQPPHIRLGVVPVDAGHGITVRLLEPRVTPAFRGLLLPLAAVPDVTAAASIVAAVADKGSELSLEHLGDRPIGHRLAIVFDARHAL